MIAICCMVSCNMVANAGNNKPISVNALPAKVQTLLSQHFNGQKVMLVTIESGVVIEVDADALHQAQLAAELCDGLRVGQALDGFAGICVAFLFRCLSILQIGRAHV